LDGKAVRTSGRSWKAIIYITVHDDNHRPIQGMKIEARWVGGLFGKQVCVTNNKGVCKITRNNIYVSVPYVALTVNYVGKPGYNYAIMLNHDIDRDTNGFTITVDRPRNLVPRN